jgi:hypothetical protein
MRGVWRVNAGTLSGLKKGPRPFHNTGSDFVGSVSEPKKPETEAFFAEPFRTGNRAFFSRFRTIAE